MRTGSWRSLREVVIRDDMFSVMIKVAFEGGWLLLLVVCLVWLILKERYQTLVGEVVK